MEEMRPNPMPSSGASESSASRGGALKTLLIIIIALLIVWGLYALFSGEGMENGEEYTVEVAPPGEVVSSFPQEFLVEADAQISGSSELTYRDGRGTLPTVEYRSQKTLAENIALFAEILSNNGWTVTKEASAGESTTNFYAVKEGNDINITLTSFEDGVQVHIAYIERIPVGE